MGSLTQRQLEVLQLIDSFQQRTGRAPTLKELLGQSGPGEQITIHHHLALLRRQGYITMHRERGVARSTVLRLNPGRMRERGASLRLLGTIPAGPLREPAGDPEDERTRIEDLVPGIRPGDYFLIVDGDSMIDAGLLHGQYVVIRPGIPPCNGDICAVWVEGLGSTLKKVFIDDDVVRLVPANSNYHTIHVPADQVQIQGVLVAALAIRSFRRR